MVSLSESNARERCFCCAYQRLVGVHGLVQCLDMQQNLAVTVSQRKDEDASLLSASVEQAGNGMTVCTSHLTASASSCSRREI